MSLFRAFVWNNCVCSTVYDSKLMRQSQQYHIWVEQHRICLVFAIFWPEFALCLMKSSIQKAVFVRHWWLIKIRLSAVFTVPTCPWLYNFVILWIIYVLIKMINMHHLNSWNYWTTIKVWIKNRHWLVSYLISTLTDLCSGNLEHFHNYICHAMKKRFKH